jgi:hypothetical protein
MDGTDNMMAAMHGRMAAMAMMRPFEHVEGHIAFYRAELGITDAQQAQWNTFADAIRAGAAKMREAIGKSLAAQPGTAPEQFQRRIELLSVHLDVLRSVSAAGGPLYASLSPEQKRKADELLAEHFGSMREMMR